MVVFQCHHKFSVAKTPTTVESPNILRIGTNHETLVAMGRTWQQQRGPLVRLHQVGGLVEVPWFPKGWVLNLTFKKMQRKMGKVKVLPTYSQGFVWLMAEKMVKKTIPLAISFLTTPGTLEKIGWQWCGLVYIIQLNVHQPSSCQSVSFPPFPKNPATIPVVNTP